MKVRFILYAALALLALAPVLGFWARHRHAPAEVHPAGRAALPGPALASPGPAEPETPGSPAPAATHVAQNLTGLLVRSRVGRLPADVARAVAAGDVDEARARLAALGRAGAAPLYRLAKACNADYRPPRPEAVAPEHQGEVDALIAAREGFAARFQAGCSAARLDTRAFEPELRSAAEAGDADALYLLASAATSADHARLMESAALLGSADAQLDRWMTPLFSKKSVEAEREGVLWLRQAARTQPVAAVFLAECLYKGCGGDAPDERAATLELERGARRGDALALALLIGPEAIPEDAKDTEVPDFAIAAEERYAYAFFAARLARAGCALFPEDALPVRMMYADETLATTLNPAELEAGAPRARALWESAGGAALAEQGCEAY
jgi:hypothetical protein